MVMVCLSSDCICDAKIDLYVCVCTYTYLINRDLDACKRGGMGEDVQHRVNSHKMQWLGATYG